MSVFGNNLMSGGPGIASTALVIVVFAVLLAGVFVFALVKSAAGLLAGGSSRRSGGRGGGGLGTFVIVFFGLAAFGLWQLWTSASHLM